MRYFLFITIGFFLSQNLWAHSGERTYQSICAACHAQGLLGAPKVADKAKWKHLIAEGQITLTAHGYVGVRKMPPKGGQPNLSLEDFSAAVVYMANQSGGNWSLPSENQLAQINQEISRRKKGLRIVSEE